MSLSNTSVESIMRTGVNVSVSAKNYGAESLTNFARIAAEAHTHLTIRDAGSSYSKETLEQIGRVGKQYLTIEV